MTTAEREGYYGLSIKVGTRVVYKGDTPFNDPYCNGRVEEIEPGDQGEVVSMEGLRNAKFGKDDSAYVRVKFDSGQTANVYILNLRPAEDTDKTVSVVEQYEAKLKSMVERHKDQEILMAKEHAVSQDNLRTKIEYLKDSGAETFDSEEFRVYTALKAVDNPNLSLMERTKIIASLIRQDNVNYKLGK